MKYHNGKSGHGVMSDKEMLAEFTEFEALINDLYPKDLVIVADRAGTAMSKLGLRMAKHIATVKRKTDPILVSEDDKTDNCQSASNLDEQDKQ